MAYRLCLLVYRMALRPRNYFVGSSSSLCRKKEGSIFPHTVFTPRVFLSQNFAPGRPDQKKKRLKSETYSKITLLEADGNLTVISLEEAEKLAKRRDLKLVRIVDKQSGSQRALYKMMTAAQYFEDEMKARKEKSEKKKNELKGGKLLSISDKIDKHDLESKIKMCKKWLDKMYEVRIIINETEASLSESVFKMVVTSINNSGKVVQKRQKGKEIKFSILPIIKKEENSVVEE